MKAVGPDELQAEIWKVPGSKGTKKLVELCKEMCVKGIWTSDFHKSCDDSFAEKDECSEIECSNHRTISLISHAPKILLKILTNRIKAKARDFVGRNQSAFRKGCGTRDAIGAMRMICERSLEFGNNVYCIFAL